MARLTDSKSVDTPMKVNVKCHEDYRDSIFYPTLHRKLVTTLIY